MKFSLIVLHVGSVQCMFETSDVFDEVVAGED